MLAPVTVAPWLGAWNDGPSLPSGSWGRFSFRAFELLRAQRPPSGLGLCAECMPRSIGEKAHATGAGKARRHELAASRAKERFSRRQC
jgi:hypothetical protein